MDILSTQAAQTVSQTSVASSQNTAALASDFETFLKMLTAQARYQDPLEPIDSSEYAAQLAQFSMVEQQVLSNDLLTNLGAQLGSNTIGQMASWIGMEAKTTAAVAFDGAPITVLPKIEAGADEAFMVVYGADGTQVQRRPIGTTGEALEWNGVLDDGSVATDGNYSFKVESRSFGDIVGTSAAESYARITEARRQGSETVLVLNSGVSVAATDITALREAS